MVSFQPGRMRSGSERWAPFGLNGVARCSEDRRVRVGVAQLVLGDLGEGVAGLDDVRAVGGVVCAGDLEHGSGQEEVGAPVEDGLVEGDELDVPRAVTEPFFGDLPEAVTALDRVALGLWLHRLHAVFCSGCDGGASASTAASAAPRATVPRLPRARGAEAARR